MQSLLPLTLVMVLTDPARSRPVAAEIAAEICTLGTVDRAQVNSIECIACHDGTIASLVHSAWDGAGFGDSHPVGEEAREGHPVDVDYAAAQLRRPFVLAPAALLPDRLTLSNGRLTCATCHDPESSFPSHVAVTLDGSALCYGCHPGY